MRSVLVICALYSSNGPKLETVKQMMDLFAQLPNHPVQKTDNGFCLQSYDALSGKTENLWDSELKRMSNQQLKDLIKKKRWQLTGKAG